jgi:hypothetical protein
MESDRRNQVSDIYHAALQRPVEDRSAYLIEACGGDSEGGRAPRWRGDGKEIYFLSVDGRMMAAAIDPITGSVSAPQKLFLLPTRLADRRSYAVTKDGQRFLIPIPEPEAQIVILQNWRAKGAQ